MSAVTDTVEEYQDVAITIPHDVIASLRKQFKGEEVTFDREANDLTVKIGDRVAVMSLDELMKSSLTLVEMVKVKLR